MVVLVVVEL
jgi:hypothetical protein